MKYLKALFYDLPVLLFLMAMLSFDNWRERRKKVKWHEVGEFDFVKAKKGAGLYLTPKQKRILNQPKSRLQIPKEKR